VYDADWLPRLTAFARSGRVISARSISTNVWALGITSLLTDASSEMIVSVLPAYLVLSAGFAPLALGMATGLHAGGPILATWLGGVVADRSGRRKLTAAAGYALSAVCRLGWWALMPTPILSMVAVFTVSDRMGKAMRTAPRDAIISLSVPPEQLAKAFGVHRALDAAGAALGPLIAWLVLWHLPHRYDVVFFASFVLALLGLVALSLLVADRPLPVGAIEPDAAATVVQGARAPFTRPLFRRVALLAAAFSFLAIGDPFLYLLLVEHSHTGPQWIPLLYTGTALSFLTLAVPLGTLADRFGRSRVFVLGHLSLLFAYAVVMGGVMPWPWTAIVCVLLLGMYYAASDGVLAGLAGGCLPARIRATGLAWIATAVAVGRLCSALLFGVLWTRYGDAFAVLAFAVALLLLMAGFSLWGGRERERAWAA
jgi:MFS family permease